jgi:DNA-binding NarL/FixJ family response regulator
LNKTIAILEPHELLRQCLDEILTFLGYDVVIKEAESLEFLNELERVQFLPNIIVMESQIAEPHDYHLIKYLRNSFPLIRLLAFSTDNSEYAVNQVMQEGVHAFLEKGCSLCKLQTVLEQLSYDTVQLVR